MVGVALVREEEVHFGGERVQVRPRGKPSLGSELCSRTQGLGTPGNLRVLRDPPTHILYNTVKLSNHPSCSLVIAINGGPQSITEQVNFCQYLAIISTVEADSNDRSAGSPLALS